MKKISVLLSILLVTIFALFALGSGESETVDQGTDSAQAATEGDSTLGLYEVEIMNCRSAKDYEGKDVAIVKYLFTNNSEEPASFMFAFEDAVYQNDIGLNEAYFLDENTNYNSDNQTKEIKKGASLEVEVAYELNEKDADLVVEVKELFSFSDKTITKTFTVNK